LPWDGIAPRGGMGATGRGALTGGLWSVDGTVT
jgi:hypothetical protein